MESSNKLKLTIAVTALNAIDSPGPGLAVILSLLEAKEFEVRIIGLAYEPLEPGIYMHDLVEKTYLLPYPSAGKEVLLERLKYIHEKEKLDFLFPNFDAELLNFIKIREALQDLGIGMLIPTEEQFEVRSKEYLYVNSHSWGIKVPYTRAIYSASELSKIIYEIGFPAVIKGQFYEAEVVHTLEQAHKYFYKLSTKWGVPVLIQQYLKGTEMNVCGLGDGKGNLIGGVPMRKLFITDKGKAWAGVSLQNEQLLELTKKWVKATNWKGPFELECMRTHYGDYYLLEINPRFPAWSYLPTGCGQNLVAAAVLLGMNQKVTPFSEYKVGKMFIRFSKDMIVDIKEFETISTLGEL